MSGGHNGKANFPRRRIRSCMTKAIRWKRKSAKSHRKAVRDKSVKHLTKEGIVSFWRLRKYVITKA